MPSVSRVFALFLSVFYFFAQVVLGSAQETNVWAQRRALTALPVSASTMSLSSALRSSTPAVAPVSPASYATAAPELQALLRGISASAATVQDVWVSKQHSTAPVLLIQDVHLNPEAQTNISMVLQSLVDQKQVGMVAMEGAFGPLPLKPFREFADKSILKIVGRSLLGHARLGGPAYVAMTSAVEPPPFIGVDDRTHYGANVRAYLDAQSQKSSVEIWLGAQKKILSVRKKRAFSAALLEFDDLRAAHQSGSLNLGTYAQALTRWAEAPDLVINQFLQAVAMEKSLDFPAVERERQTVVEKLSRRLTEPELKDLVDQSLAYRAGRLGFGDYYRGLRRLCERKRIVLSQTRAFDDYIRYALLSDGIKADALFEAMDRWEQEIVNQLATTPEAKEIASQSELLAFERNLANFSLTAREWEKYRTAVLSSSFLVLSKELKSFESFYEEADIRSEKMVNNLLSLLSTKNEEPRTPSILVVGGFHTPHIARLLKQRNISYVVISPKITKVDTASGSAYLSVFAREKTPIEKLFEGERLFLAPTGPSLAPASAAAAYAALIIRTIRKTPGSAMVFISKSSGFSKKDHSLNVTMRDYSRADQDKDEPSLPESLSWTNARKAMLAAVAVGIASAFRRLRNVLLWVCLKARFGGDSRVLRRIERLLPAGDWEHLLSVRTELGRLMKSGRIQFDPYLMPHAKDLLDRLALLSVFVNGRRPFPEIRMKWRGTALNLFTDPTLMKPLGKFHYQVDLLYGLHVSGPLRERLDTDTMAEGLHVAQQILRDDLNLRSRVPAQATPHYGALLEAGEVLIERLQHWTNNRQSFFEPLRLAEHQQFSSELTHVQGHALADAVVKNIRRWLDEGRIAPDDLPRFVRAYIQLFAMVDFSDVWQLGDGQLFDLGLGYLAHASFLERSQKLWSMERFSTVLKEFENLIKALRRFHMRNLTENMKGSLKTRGVDLDWFAKWLDGSEDFLDRGLNPALPLIRLDAQLNSIRALAHPIQLRYEQHAQNAAQRILSLSSTELLAKADRLTQPVSVGGRLRALKWLFVRKSGGPFEAWYDRWGVVVLEGLAFLGVGFGALIVGAVVGLPLSHWRHAVTSIPVEVWTSAFHRIWVVFAIAHVIDVAANPWRVPSERAPPKNIGLSLMIGGVNIVLGDVLSPLWASVASFIVHGLVNYVTTHFTAALMVWLKISKPISVYASLDSDQSPMQRKLLGIVHATHLRLDVVRFGGSKENFLEGISEPNLSDPIDTAEILCEVLDDADPAIARQHVEQTLRSVAAGERWVKVVFMTSDTDLLKDGETWTSDFGDMPVMFVDKRRMPTLRALKEAFVQPTGEYSQFQFMTGDEWERAQIRLVVPLAFGDKLKSFIDIADLDEERFHVYVACTAGLNPLLVELFLPEIPTLDWKEESKWLRQVLAQA